MAKVKILVLLAVVAILAVALIPAVASAQPVPPCRIHGTAVIDGELVAGNTVITATIDGDTYTATTPSAYGASIYLLQIAQPDGKSYVGKAISFKIGPEDAIQTATWVQGGNLELNLVKGSPVATPIPGGQIKGVSVNMIDPGSVASGNIIDGKLVLNIPKAKDGVDGAAGKDGKDGTNGTNGTDGENGKDASNALGIVALIIAIVALVVVIAAVLLRRKAPA
jgi:flagellar basal body-associated protein FliL